MKGSIHIAATGTRTPLGLRSDACAAAVRAGISRLGSHPKWLDRLGEPMVAALDAQLDPGLPGPERMLALAEGALRDLFARAPKLRGAYAQVPVHLALPEARPGFTEQDAVTIGTRLAQLSDLPCALAPVQTHARGHAAGVLALEAAQTSFSHGHELCIVGGAESYFSEATMNWLDDHGQLAGESGRSSFVPGEGAGFLLLASRAGLRKLDLESEAELVASATTHEKALIKTPALCLGEGLTAAVTRAVSGLGEQRINGILCDINGERYRGTEWGFVCLRLAQHFDDPASYRSPADLWGDMGAASIPLFAMLACESAARGYQSGPLNLLWASSEAGLRGAVVLKLAQQAAHTGGPKWRA